MPLSQITVLVLLYARAPLARLAAVLGRKQP
jgi:hypothetical protein